MRWAIIALLLFEPIVIDEAAFTNIMQTAHQNFRGPEFDMLNQMLNRLEQQAIQGKMHKDDKDAGH
jgi:hypothetical protein